MSNQNPHLRRRGAIYHYRRRLPAPLKEILNQTYFDGSLATADPVRARKLARRISVALDQLSEHLQGMPAALKPTSGQLNLVLREIFDSILHDGDRRRALQGDDFPALGSWNRERLAKGEADPDEWEDFEYCQRQGIFYDEVPEATAERWRDRASLKLLDDVDPYLTAALKITGTEVDPDYSYPTGLRQDALNIIAQAYEADLERWNGNYGADQRAPGWIDDKYPVAPVVLQAWSGRLTAEEVNFLALTVEQVAAQYFERYLQHTRAPKTQRDWEMALRYFVSLAGKERIGDITESDVDRFREELLKVPSGFGKGIYAGLTPRQAIEKREALYALVKDAKKTDQQSVFFEEHEWSLAEAERKTATMTRKTANKHLSFFTKLWTSRVVPKPLRPMSPFAGALYPKSEVRQDKVRAGRVEYTQEQLKELFTSALWTGCQSPSRRAISGDLIIPDARFWAPLIAAFTGMRREEVCQLKDIDFSTHNGIWFFKVQATEGRHLKTPAAERDIPIPEELLRIGLLDYMHFRKPGWLFPELRPSEKDRMLGDSLGKWFHRYRHSIGLDKAETDFHSFRTTFIQYLRRAGVPLDHIKPITGHAENDITIRHYAPAFSIEQKREVIEKFDLGVSFPQLYGRMPELLANLEAPPKRRLARRRKTEGSPLDEAAAAE